MDAWTRHRRVNSFIFPRPKKDLQWCPPTTSALSNLWNRPGLVFCAPNRPFRNASPDFWTKARFSYVGYGLNDTYKSLHRYPYPHMVLVYIYISVIPKFMKFSQGTLALINNLTMPRGAYFQIFKEIIPNSKFAVIIWFWHFLANIFQFLALRITLSKIFFNKIYFKLHFIVCANVLSLLEVDLTLWIFIWKHSNMQLLRIKNFKQC